MRHDSADQRSNAEAEHQEAGPGTDNACARFESGAASDTAARVPATAKAPPSPCSARAPITTIPAGATAISNEARANTPMPTVEEYRGAEPVRRLAAENDEYRGSEQVGVDDPFNLRRAECKPFSSSPAEPP